MYSNIYRGDGTSQGDALHRGTIIFMSIRKADPAQVSKDVSSK